jgi:hypothetical protein
MTDPVAYSERDVDARTTHRALIRKVYIVNQGQPRSSPKTSLLDLHHAPM